MILLYLFLQDYVPLLEFSYSKLTNVFRSSEMILSNLTCIWRRSLICNQPDNKTTPTI